MKPSSDLGDYKAICDQWTVKEEEGQEINNRGTCGVITYFFS